MPKAPKARPHSHATKRTHTKHPRSAPHASLSRGYGGFLVLALFEAPSVFVEPMCIDRPQHRLFKMRLAVGLWLRSAPSAEPLGHGRRRGSRLRFPSEDLFDAARWVPQGGPVPTEAEVLMGRSFAQMDLEELQLLFCDMRRKLFSDEGKNCLVNELVTS